MTVDLVAFLKDALDEDERTDAPHTDHCSAKSGDGHDFRPDLCDCGWAERVLVEVAAKRAIIDDETFAGSDGTPNCQGHPGPWLNHGDHGPGYCRDYSDSRILRALAAPYRDRPGFDPSWLD